MFKSTKENPNPTIAINITIFFNSKLYNSLMKPWNFNFPLSYNTIEKTQDLAVTFGNKECEKHIKLEDFQKSLLQKKQRISPSAQKMEMPLEKGEDKENKLQAFSFL